jgi:2,3-bisphosphoglycerate-dependent phosphoglycerate mutase
MAHPASTTLLVTHGNLMTLLLKRFDDRIGCPEWQQLTNPDIYRITRAGSRIDIARFWNP